MKPTDAEKPELIRRFLAGDDDAFRALVAAVLPRLRRWALVRTGDPDDADEVVQRTLIAMYRGLGRFRGRGDLSSWLYRILANAATDLARERAARERATRGPSRDGADRSGDPSDDPLRGIHSHRLARAVRSFLDALPARQREVLELVDHGGMSPKEAAAALGMKATTLRVNLFKARRAVRTRVLERFPELREGYEP